LPGVFKTLPWVAPSQTGRSLGIGRQGSVKVRQTKGHSAARQDGASAPRTVLSLSAAARTDATLMGSREAPISDDATEEGLHNSMRDMMNDADDDDDLDAESPSSGGGRPPEPDPDAAGLSWGFNEATHAERGAMRFLNLARSYQVPSRHAVHGFVILRVFAHSVGQSKSRPLACLPARARFVQKAAKPVDEDLEAPAALSCRSAEACWSGAETCIMRGSVRPAPPAEYAERADSALLIPKYVVTKHALLYFYRTLAIVLHVA